MKKILFVKSNPPYNTGDYALFPDEMAKRLVNGGKACFPPSVKKSKNVEEPPEDKMVRSAEVKKK